MKIAQVVCTWPPYSGGIGNSAFQIEQLMKASHEIVNFTPTTIKPWLQYGHGALLPQLLWKLKKFDYIYLHYPFFGTAEIVWLFNIFYKKPKLIIHYHMDVSNSSLLTRILSLPSLMIRKSLLRRADTIITASLDYIKNSQIKSFYKKYPEKFKEIPFAVDTEKYRPKKLNQVGSNRLIEKTKNIIHYVNNQFIKRNRLDLVFVGALDRAHYFKGVNILLSALVILPTRNWHLKIVGEGNLQENYKHQAKELKIDKQIEFTGRLSEPQLIKTLQNSDLLVLPSINHNEAFGLVLIEALACGLPIIASDLPGVRSVFTNYHQGLLIEPQSVDDLKQKLEFIINNKTMLPEMAIAARKLAEKKYSFNRLRKNLEEIFN